LVAVSVAEFVAGVDRLLARAHALYPSEGAAGPLTGGAAGGAVPGVPGGSSALAQGASTAGAGYQRSQTTAGSLDQALEQAAGEGSMIAEQGRTGSGAILEQARTFAKSAMPLSNTAAGAQLVVATMDQHVNAMHGQLQQTQAANAAVSSQLRETSAGYQELGGGLKDTPAVPLDSPKLKPGQKHRPFIAGPGVLGPPNYPDGRWVDVYDKTKDPDKVTHTFIPESEIPHYQEFGPGVLGPSTVNDAHGNPDPFIELAPNSGVWVPKSDFPGAKFFPPGGGGELPPYGWDEYVPGSGIYVWGKDLLPCPYVPPGGSSLPPATYPQSGR
jgi:hypothetical protein